MSDRALLGDVASVVMGQSPPGTEVNTKREGLALLNGPTEFGAWYPTPVQWTTAPRKVAEPGDILFCVRGSTTGRMNVADQRYCIGRGVAAIKAHGDPDNANLLLHVIQMELPRLLSLTSGSVFPNLSFRDLASFEITWPCEPRRTRVAALVRIIDERIQWSQHLIRKCRALAIAQFGVACEGASLVELSDLAVATRRQVDPSALGQEVVSHFSIPAFDAGEMPEEIAADQILSNKFAVPADCVLVSRLNPRFPRVWLVDGFRTSRAVASTEFLVLEPSVNCRSSDLWLVCSAAAFREEMMSRVTGTSGSHQRVRAVDAGSIRVPDVRGLSQSDRGLVGMLLGRSEAGRREGAMLARVRDGLLAPLLVGEAMLGDIEQPARLPA
jgi:type I restriction enzyme S subunit